MQLANSYDKLTNHKHTVLAHCMCNSGSAQYVHNSGMRAAMEWKLRVLRHLTLLYTVTICFPKLTVPEQRNIGKVIFPEVIRRKTHRYHLLCLEIGIFPKFHHFSLFP